MSEETKPLISFLGFDRLHKYWSPIGKFLPLWLLGFVIISLMCFVFLFIKEAIYPGVARFYGDWGYLLTRAVIPLTIGNVIFCYVPFVIGICIEKSLATCVKLYWVSLSIFLFLTTFLWFFFFYSTGYYEALSGFPPDELSEWLYLIITPVTLMTVGSHLLYIFKKDEYRTNEKIITKNRVFFIKDIVIIFTFCAAFTILTQTGFGLLFFTPDMMDSFSWVKLSYALVMLTIVGVVTCYPPFLIGCRILKSKKWFCLLSWGCFLGVSLIFYRTHIFEYILNSILSPRFILAMAATVWWVREILQAKREGANNG